MTGRLDLSFFIERRTLKERNLWFHHLMFQKSCIFSRKTQEKKNVFPSLDLQGCKNPRWSLGSKTWRRHVGGGMRMACPRWTMIHFHQWQTCLKNPPDTSLQGGPPENEIVGGIACINHMIIIYWHENLMELMMLWWSHDGTQTELLPFSVNSPQLPTSNHYKADCQGKELIPSVGWVQSKLNHKVPTFVHGSLLKSENSWYPHNWEQLPWLSCRDWVGDGP